MTRHNMPLPGVPGERLFLWACRAWGRTWLRETLQSGWPPVCRARFRVELCGSDRERHQPCDPGQCRLDPAAQRGLDHV